MKLSYGIKWFYARNCIELHMQFYAISCIEPFDSIRQFHAWNSVDSIGALREILRKSTKNVQHLKLGMHSNEKGQHLLKMSDRVWNFKEILQIFGTEVLILGLSRRSTKVTQKYHDQEPKLNSSYTFTAFFHIEMSDLFFC